MKKLEKHVEYYHLLDQTYYTIIDSNKNQYLCSKRNSIYDNVLIIEDYDIILKKEAHTNFIPVKIIQTPLWKLLNFE